MLFSGLDNATTVSSLSMFSPSMEPAQIAASDSLRADGVLRSNPDVPLRPPSSTSPAGAAASTPATSLSSPQSQPRASTTRPKRSFCRFYTSKSGCRAGDACAFLHEPNTPSLVASRSTRRKDEKSGHTGQQKSTGPSQNTSEVVVVDGMVQDRRQATRGQVSGSRVVSRPVPKAEQQDPRGYQLGQLRRRFAPKEIVNDDGTVLKFSVAPSDPDFPFEITALDCVLTVPPAYPDEAPRLRVVNSDIPRGFAINVERGFDSLIEQGKYGTLLALMNALDKNLEVFLSEKKAETVKLVANADRRHLNALPVRSIGDGKKAELQESVALPAAPRPSSPVKWEPVFSSAEKEEAERRRAQETRQLENRLGRLPLYHKSSDGIAYTLPIEPRKRSELPPAVQAVKTVKLFVPLPYPLQPCRIHIEGVSGPEASAIEKAFETRARDEAKLNLTFHLNYLAQNMHVMAKAAVAQQIMKKPGEEQSQQVQPSLDEADYLDKQSKHTHVQTKPDIIQDEGREHIKVIPRPPEWTTGGNSSSESDDEEESYSPGSGDEDGLGTDNGDSDSLPRRKTVNVEHGTALSFPSLGLENIELLELSLLNLSIKCERCKEIADISGLADSDAKTTECHKCAAKLSVTFRKTLAHQFSSRVGFVDLEGCTVVGMLPSSFIPTCASCSSPFNTPGITTLPSDRTTQVCRTCHTKLTLSLPALKLLHITPQAPTTTPSGSRRPKTSSNLHANSALPDNGTCKHYRKSHRWFRFSCCGKVYPCDVCHDQREEHVNERAEYMICGWCSREGRYAPDTCSFCGRWVVGGSARRGMTQFWEGGKGMRDRSKMSRKDPRKYKRIGGGG